MKRFLLLSVILVLLVAGWNHFLARPTPGHPARRGPAPKASPRSTGPLPAEVARQFAVAFLGYDWRQAGGAAGRADAVSPWVTPDLDGQLAVGPGASAADESKRAGHEVDLVGPVTVAVDDAAAGAIGASVSAPVSISQDGDQPVTVWRYLDLRVVLQGGSWRVAAVQM